MFHAAAAPRMSGLKRLGIDGELGTWRVRPAHDYNQAEESVIGGPPGEGGPPPRAQKTPEAPNCGHNPPGRSIRRGACVIKGVPTEDSPSKVMEGLVAANAARLQIPEAQWRDRIRSVRRLDRRSSTADDGWTPSTSVLLEGDPALIDRLLADGGVVYAYRTLHTQPFQMPIRRCYHCGGEGHLARHCRSRCLFCGHRHPTQDCPSGRRVPGAGPPRRASGHASRRSQPSSTSSLGPRSTPAPTQPSSSCSLGPKTCHALGSSLSPRSSPTPPPSSGAHH